MFSVQCPVCLQYKSIIECNASVSLSSVTTVPGGATPSAPRGRGPWYVHGILGQGGSDHHVALAIAGPRHWRGTTLHREGTFSSQGKNILC